MEDKRITAEEILAEIDIDVNQMAQKVAGYSSATTVARCGWFLSYWMCCGP